MTLQQLEYILALDRHRHFLKAANSCGVTQPSLSAMIQKLEEELGVRIFDRNTVPITPTPVGQNIIQQARSVLFQITQLKESIRTEQKEVRGSLNLSVIPTVAPYLLPRFFETFSTLYPDIKVTISEMQTSVILERLLSAKIDLAILATPLDKSELLEVPLYYEKFIAYVSPTDPLYTQKELKPSELPLERIWLLQEGHCLRNQVMNLCGKIQDSPCVYEAGSIDTLIRIVDRNGGFTVLPELHIAYLTEEQTRNLRPLAEPEATREISMVMRQDFIREGVLNAVANIVREIIPESMLDTRLKKYRIRL